MKNNNQYDLNQFIGIANKVNSEYDHIWQIIQEECAELIVECSKVVRGKARPDKLLEELGDVFMCLTRILLSIDKDYNDLVEVVLNKLKERDPDIFENKDSQRVEMNLSEEHINKGCELIHEYDNPLGIGLCYNGEDFIDRPRYRDFVQLIIEEIERRYKIAIVVHRLGDTDTTWAIIDSKGRLLYKETKKISRVEAKEKAIAYVFDNMGSICESDKCIISKKSMRNKSE